MNTRTRYPGAQPFPDTDVSRRTFFGREQSSAALTDQILANRLVIVYAKSGVGKTSLLNAGVAPRLREAGSLPLLVRVNDTQRGPLISVLEGIRAEAERQQVEYVPGTTRSLWEFFKSVEFWREDLLLTPVLIIDQFEELFTVQSEEAREAFLTELGPLVRGVPPAHLAQADADSEAAPSVRVLLCLREDFLGLLEEAADHIPQIMDHRFRLTPLTRQGAQQAIIEPAAISDETFATKPFRLEPKLVTTILDYLSNSASGVRNPKRQYVEPFQVQLICHRIEQLVDRKQRLSTDDVAFSLEDLGGEPALRRTLEDFYTDAINSVPEKHLRPAARRLCEQFLISPEGRRLSLDERELQRQLGLPQATLRRLVESRLLRSDRRSDSTHYELSHDALVDPVLASRRTKALFIGWTRIVGGGAFSLLMFFFTLVCIYAVFEADTRSGSFGFMVATPFPAICIYFGIQLLREGLRTRERYRRHVSSEFAEPLPILRPLKIRLVAWTLIGSGGAMLAVGGLDLVATLTAVRTLYNGPFLEISWSIITISAESLFGWMLWRSGRRRLWLHEAFPSFASNQSPSVLLGILKALSGVLVLSVAVAVALVLGQCSFESRGRLPNWLPRTMTPMDLSHVCSSPKDWGFYFFQEAVVVLGLAWLSVALLRSAVQNTRSMLRREQPLRKRALNP
jgi:hypothetical protein